MLATIHAESRFEDPKRRACRQFVAALQSRSKCRTASSLKIWRSGSTKLVALTAATLNHPTLPLLSAKLALQGPAESTRLAVTAGIAFWNLFSSILSFAAMLVV